MVFRGVRVGSVTSVGVLYDKATGTFLIPVLADLERDAVRGLDGKRTDKDDSLSLPRLVQRGLRAQLSMQSLLTGLLYVDLDLRPDHPVKEVHGSYRGAVEIPTTSTAIQNLKQQLENMDFRQLLDDVSAIAASARQLAASPEMKKAFDDFAQIAASIKRMSTRLEQRIGPLTDNANRTLAGASSAFDRLGSAADGVRNTAQGFKGTSDRMSALLAPDSPLLRQIQLAAEELARTAAALRQVTSGDSSLVRNGERTLQDLSRASRALRDLAEMLEQHPESLVRGRGAPAPSPGFTPAASPAASPASTPP